MSPTPPDSTPSTDSAASIQSAAAANAVVTTNEQTTPLSVLLSRLNAAQKDRRSQKSRGNGAFGKGRRDKRKK